MGIFGNSSGSMVWHPKVVTAYELYAVFSLIVVTGTLLVSPSQWELIVGLLVLGLIPVFLANRRAPNGAYPSWTGYTLPKIDCDVGTPSADETFRIAREMGAQLRASAGLWVVENRSGVEARRNAGAEATVARRRVACALGTGGYFESNVEVWRIGSDALQVAVLPQWVLLIRAAEVQRFPIEQCSFTFAPQNFVEDEWVPPDATIVQQTWLYVCNDGSPDRRFANNRPLPVALYGGLVVGFPDGNQLSILGSNAGAIRAAVDSFARLCAVRTQPVLSPPPVHSTPVFAVHQPISPPSAPPTYAPSFAVAQTPSIEAALAPPPVLVSMAELEKSMGQTHWRTLAVLLKRVALADRKFSDSELTEMVQMLRAWSDSALENDVAFRETLRALTVDDASVFAAISAVGRASVDERRKIFGLCRQMSMADGRLTPKEAERLAEFSQAWGLGEQSS